MGLHLSPPVRYGRWLAHFLQGDMGISTHYQTAVGPLLGRRLLNSAILAGVAFALIMPLALGLGIIAGYARGRSA